MKLNELDRNLISTYCDDHNFDYVMHFYNLSDIKDEYFQKCLEEYKIARARLCMYTSGFDTDAKFPEL